MAEPREVRPQHPALLLQALRHLDVQVLGDRLVRRGVDRLAHIGDNAVETLIHRLRKKLSGAGATVELKALRGLGYLLVEVPE